MTTVDVGLSVAGLLLLGALVGVLTYLLVSLSPWLAGKDSTEIFGFGRRNPRRSRPPARGGSRRRNDDDDDDDNDDDDLDDDEDQEDHRGYKYSHGDPFSAQQQDLAEDDDGEEYDDDDDDDDD